MAKWINRTVVQAPRNGTASHTINFTPAAAGSLLVMVIEGAVTHTTPTGWTKQASGLQSTEIAVFSKTATAAEASFTTTHNGSNYPVGVVVYEFAAGSTFVKATGTQGVSDNNGTSSSITSLTGTNLLMVATGHVPSNGTIPSTFTWSAPSGIVKDAEFTVFGGATDGYSMSVAIVEDSTATSFAPTSSVTWASGNSRESVTWAVNAVAETAAYSTIFTGTDGSPWPAIWGHRSNGSQSIQGNRGRLDWGSAYAASSAQYTGQFGNADLELATTFYLPSGGFCNLNIRSNPEINGGRGYNVQVIQGQSTIAVQRAGTASALDYSTTALGTYTIPTGAWTTAPTRMRMQVYTEATRVVIRVKAWATLTASEPASWGEYYDTSTDRITDENYMGISGYSGGAGYMDVDDVTIQTLSVNTPPATNLIYSGTTAPTAYYVGTTAVSKLMVGSTQIWP